MKVKKLFSYPAYHPRKNTLRFRRKTFSLACLVCGAFLFSVFLSGPLALLMTPAWAHETEPHPHAEDSKAAHNPSLTYKHPQHGSLGAIGAKLANPLSDVWALNTSFNMPQFYDGDVNSGDPQLGATLLFQPILPIPLHGTGDGAWRLITRPIIPVIFSEPIPEGFNEFDL